MMIQLRRHCLGMVRFRHDNELIRILNFIQGKNLSPLPCNMTNKTVRNKPILQRSFSLGNNESTRKLTESQPHDCVDVTRKVPVVKTRGWPRVLQQSFFPYVLGD